MEKYGFIYIWYDRKHKRFYIGSHWGYIEDNYICSSRWMRKSYNRRKEDFEREILVTNIKTRLETLEEEYKWLQLIPDEELGKSYYNLRNCEFSHWTTDPDKRLTISEKLSKSIKLKWQDPVYREKSINTYKTSEKRKENRIKATEASRLVTIGKEFSEERRNKISKALIGNKNNLGISRSIEANKKQSDSMKLAWKKRKENNNLISG